MKNKTTEGVMIMRKKTIGTLTALIIGLSSVVGYYSNNAVINDFLFNDKK